MSKPKSKIPPAPSSSRRGAGEGSGRQPADKQGRTTTKSKELISVRRLHRRDLNRVWEFLKLVFRGVNKNTLEYQRPRTKGRFMEVYDIEDTEQLIFETNKSIVGYAECSYTPAGTDNWMNPRYFDKRGMRPLFVDELAVHPNYQGRGVGGFMLEQLQHLARVHGCTHLVLEVAQNNRDALTWYHKRKFFRLDAAIFLAQKVPQDAELLPARPLKARATPGDGTPTTGGLAVRPQPPLRKRQKVAVEVDAQPPAAPPSTRARDKATSA